jgi:hypothetical protein
MQYIMPVMYDGAMREKELGPLELLGTCPRAFQVVGACQFVCGQVAVALRIRNLAKTPPIPDGHLSTLVLRHEKRGFSCSSPIVWHEIESTVCEQNAASALITPSARHVLARRSLARI